MKSQKHNPKGDHRSSKLKILLAVISLLTWHLAARAQSTCTQLPGQTTYSRVINDALSNPQNFLQADYDNVNNEVYVSTTYTGTGANLPFLSKVQGNSVINWAFNYPYSGNDITMAAKKATNKDELIAGATLISTGSWILFLERIDPTGHLKWARYFYQTNTNLNSIVVVTESAIRKDIVLASSANSLANDIVLVRLDSNGNQLYYDDHPIFAAGNGVEHYPTINAITPTFDDGYVVVGNTGHNWDFFAATVMKYDQKYNITPTHALNWSYLYRHYLPVYDLWTPGERSSTFAHGVCQDPVTHDIIVVGRQGDNDQYGTSVTYQNGFIIVLKPTGALIKLDNYVPANGDFLTFNAVNMTGSDYIISGSDQDPISGNYRTLITKVSASTMAPAWATYYGTNNMNVGYSVFPTSSGYISVGISNDNATPNQPQVLAVDGNGQVATCYTSLSVANQNDSNDRPLLTVGPSTSAQDVPVQAKTDSMCETMYHICGPSCPQLSPKTHYSRVINDNFNTNNFLQADYDSTNDSIYVPSTYVGGSVPDEIFWSNVALNSTINFSNRYTINGTENALAIKKSYNGDVLIAGYTQDPSGNHVLFLMRTNSAGIPYWYEYFEQTNTNLSAMVVLTETEISHDIVVASSPNSLANDIVLLRVKGSTGALYYYDDHSQYASPNTVEHYPTINGITPTHDDGYVVVGNTGHNWDFFAATIIKYDAYFHPGLVHAQDWWYIWRHKLTSYDLWIPGERSATFAHAAIEEPGTDHIVVVGYRSDNDQYGTNATYQYGWILQLDSSGIYVNSKSYVNGLSWFMSFNGITINKYGDYVITGSLRDSAAYTYQTLIMKIHSANLNPIWAELYGTNSTNIGYSIFTSPNGFLSVGISNDYSSTPQPHILSVDSLGMAGQCYTSLGTDFVLDQNDIPKLVTGASTSAQVVSPQVIDSTPCESMYDLCSTAQAPQKAGIAQAQALKMGRVSVYPNPAYDKLNIDLMVSTGSRGIMVLKDLLGNTILTNDLTMNSGLNHFEINTSALKPGIYFVQITDDKNAVNSISKIQKY